MSYTKLEKAREKGLAEDKKDVAGKGKRGRRRKSAVPDSEDERRG
jgi:hypothetical protein